MEDNMMRKEFVLILPKNTLRLTDAMMQMEINNANGKPLTEGFNDMLWKLVTRTNKDLSKYNKGVDKSLIDELYEKNFATYYDLSPRTIMYQILDIMAHQRFIGGTTVLFSDKSINKPKDDAFNSDYYDGSIESLENYLNNNGITCLILDDIELLKELNDRKNFSLESKTILLSKIGYNYYKDDKTKKLKLKHYDELHKENPSMELCTLNLFNFPKDTMNKFNKKNNNKKG